MSDTLADLKSKIPPLDQDDITNWLLELKVVLMGKKRAHLAINNPRPLRNDAEADALGPAALRRYEEQLKDDQDDWDERNDIAMSALMESANGPNSLEAKQIIKAQLIEGKTSKEITEALVNRFDSNDPRVVNALMKNWSQLLKVPGEKATSYITRLNEKRTELAKKGKVFTNGELVGRLLDGIAGDEKYAANVAAMNTIPNLQFDEAVKQLRYKDIVDGINENEPKPTVVAFSSAKSSTNTRLKSGTGEKIVCQICTKPGHSAAKCHWRNKPNPQTNQPPRQNQQKRSGKRDVSKDKCFNCNKIGHHGKDCTQPDRRKTGGSSNTGTDGPNQKKQKTTNNGPRVSFDDDITEVHMIRSRDSSDSPKTEQRSEKSSKRSRKAYGDSAAGKNCWRIGDLPDATVLEPTSTIVQTASEAEQLYPLGKASIGPIFDEILVFRDEDLHKNLISLPRLDDKGYKIEIRNQKMIIKDPHGSTVLEGTKEDDLYAFEIQLLDKSFCLLADSNPGVSQTQKLKISHCLCGHRNLVSIFQYIKNDLIDLKYFPRGVTIAEIKALELCDACMRAKFTKMRRRGRRPPRVLCPGSHMLRTRKVQ